MTPDDPLIVDAEFLARQAWSLRWSSRQRSCEMAEAALEASDRQSVTGSAYRTLAWQSRWRGSFRWCGIFGRKALEVLDPVRSPDMVGDVHASLAVMHYSSGRRDLGIDAVESGFRAIGPQGHTETRVDLMAVRSRILRHRNRPEECLSMLLRAQELVQGAPAARIQMEIARHLNATDEPEEALRHGLEAVVKAQHHDNRLVLPYAFEVVAATQIALGQLVRARRHLEDAWTCAEETEDTRARCLVRYQRGRLARAEGNPYEALAEFEAGLEAARMMPYAYGEARLHRELAELHEEAGLADAALASWKSYARLKRAESD
ncbi:tetratricopeptide repeat protein [Histidinibacterium aquaticum]|uniref:Tetratricopeptide repeat protein n=1 Tax=Histidinibacterium aquaticum TaxID=2613962 RepID=A0A5J5GG10_9RHOB|nr:hypothetical protein [Histidinibacterium aquaticum]KAA9007027.1 hypothetical protein F3S47_14785 [Histidinibacterium aquaticum]